MPRNVKPKECVVVEVTDKDNMTVAARVEDTTAAKNWLKDNGEAGKMYRIAFLRPEAYSIEMPEPRRKLTEWGE
jgi:hypothetical protein